MQAKIKLPSHFKVLVDLFQKVQWSQFLLQQGPVYDVKVPISDGYSTI